MDLTVFRGNEIDAPFSLSVPLSPFPTCVVGLHYRMIMNVQVKHTVSVPSNVRAPKIYTDLCK
jgi:hypothetical protein